VGREKLFPAQSDDDPQDTRKPQERFEDFASNLMRVTKEEIDKREKEWRDNKR
jgi:hypothetical protein